MMCIIENIVARLTAKKFNIWTEEVDDNRKPTVWPFGDWIAANGKLYNGHPLLIFFESPHNKWWLRDRQHENV